MSPDSKWVAFSKQDRTLRSHVYIAPIGGGEERHVSDDSLLYAENEAVWTADGQYLVFTSTEGVSNGIATQGGINGSTELWVLSLRDHDRDPMNRDIDNEAQGLAAQAEARQNAARTGGARRRLTSASTGAAWRGARSSSRCRATPSAALTPAPEGRSVALTIAPRAAGGGPGGGGGGGADAGMFIINVESGQLTRVPRPAPQCRRDDAAAPRAAVAAVLAAGPASSSRAMAARSTSGRATGCLPRRSISMPGAGGGPAAARGGADAAARRPKRRSRRAATPPRAT